MHSRKLYLAGTPDEDTDRVMIMLHGRGGNSRGIVELAPALEADELALVAPQATGNTWYPHSFLAKPNENEPWLSSALDLLKGLTDELAGDGFPPSQVYLLGFSQGACLALEFAARNADQWGGIIAFTGGLIGDRLYRENYTGDFKGAPIFISTGNPDSHVPVERVKESVRVLEEMNANVDLQIYDNRPHTVSKDELERAKRLISGK